jgi:hypothetical protein
MMTARRIVQELIRFVDPPRGTAIVLNEAPSTKPDDPNWIEYPAIMDPMRSRLLSEKAAELRKSHPHIDWSDGDGVSGIEAGRDVGARIVIVPTGPLQPSSHPTARASTSPH